MKLEVLHVPDCPNLPPMLERLAEVTDLPVTTLLTDSDAAAARFGMAGSPTLLIDGLDPFTGPGQCECGLACRLYRDEHGRIVPAPSVEQLREVLSAAGQPSKPGEVLSAWRTRALPLDLVEKAAHQAILRHFATTAMRPRPADSTPSRPAAGAARPTC